MTELEFFKLGHEAKDVANMADIALYKKGWKLLSSRKDGMTLISLLMKFRKNIRPKQINITRDGRQQKHPKKEHPLVTSF